MDTFPVTLNTPRLVLRGWCDDDLDAYHAMMMDPQVVRWTGNEGEVPTRAQAWRHMASMIGHWHLRGYSMFAVVERSSGQLAGRIGPWRPEGWPGEEIGWALAPGARGKGYAAEAARCAIQWMFATHAPPRLISLIRPDNTASIKVAEQLGERHLKNIEWHGQPCAVYGITLDEFT